MTFTMRIRSTSLWIAPYSPYQAQLHTIIQDMRQQGHSYNKIAKLLNEKNIKTPRGKLFRSAHVHSILKKKKLRDTRLMKSNTITIQNIELLFL